MAHSNNSLLTSMLAKSLGGYAGVMMEPPPQLAFDYTQPQGEKGLVPHDSVSWRIFKNPVSLFIGGIAAVILELAEPSVRAGVWDHSSFRTDPITRLRRTGAAAMMTVYGPRSAAEKMIAGVVRAHERVRGVTPKGDAYRANDPKLLNWVQATASFGFIEAYSQFVTRLSPEEVSQAFAEGAEAAGLYGAPGAPSSRQEWEKLLLNLMPTLEPSATLEEFLGIMARAPLLPRLARPLQDMMIRAALEIIPEELRETLGLEERRLSPLSLAVVKAAGKFADKIPVHGAPPVQASIRMGRDPYFLYSAPQT